MKHRPALLLAWLAAASMSFGAFAAEPLPAAKAEVGQLLARLENSGCQFQRNGSWHSAAEARVHLQRKYQYLLDKHLLRTTEDFIALGAAQSSTSGKSYLVKCAGQPQVTSQAWMTARLKELRAGKN